MLASQTIAKWEANKELNIHSEQKYRLSLFRPVLIYTGMSILHSFGLGDPLLQTICVIIIFVMAAMMCAGVLSLKNGIRRKYAIEQLIFYVITWFLTVILSQYIGNILTMVLACIHASLWLKMLSHTMKENV